MDGAGRLDRSARSLGPQADLKAAAIGAVVSLRERLFRRRPKPTLDREPQDRWVALVDRYLPARSGIAATVLILLGSAAFVIVKGGHIEAFTTAVSASGPACLMPRTLPKCSINRWRVRGPTPGIDSN